MKQPSLQWIVFTGVLTAATAGILMTVRYRMPEPAGFNIPRHVEYGFTIQNPTNLPMKEVVFRTFGPALETANQRCARVQASHPYQRITDDLGNQILSFIFREIPPFTSKIVSISADILFPVKPGTAPRADALPYLRPEKYCEVDHPEIRSTASKLRDQNKSRTAEKIFWWVVGHMRYTGYLKNARGALYALRQGKGDCTEYMYLFAALCRASGIPARCIDGYVLDENTILRPGGYHNWVEFRPEGRWEIADPQKKGFMQDPSRYLAMRLLGPSRGSLEKGLSLYTGEDGLRIRMNG